MVTVLEHPASKPSCSPGFKVKDCFFFSWNVRGGRFKNSLLLAQERQMRSSWFVLKENIDSYFNYNVIEKHLLEWNGCFYFIFKKKRFHFKQLVRRCGAMRRITEVSAAKSRLVVNDTELQLRRGHAAFKACHPERRWAHVTAESHCASSDAHPPASLFASSSLPNRSPLCRFPRRQL